MVHTVKYPAPGCIVEYLEDNEIQTAMVLEENSGKLRLLLPSRREVKMSANRLLPWSGPLHSSESGRDEAVRILESHKKLRKERSETINPVEVWEIAAGEVDQAPAVWFAELYESEPDADWVAAFGRALLSCKTHFRFQPPEFEVYDNEKVNRRLEARRVQEEKESQVRNGVNFLHKLWELAQKRQTLDPADEIKYLPDPEARARMERLLRAKMYNPDSQEDSDLWNQISRSLPDVPHMPLQLLTAWGKIPPHYNFWLDRADFEAGEDWCADFASDIGDLVEKARNPGIPLEDMTSLPFISIDGPTTKDIDDAFYIEPLEDGYNLLVALAFPALAWPFGSAFDKKILHRASSLYLPEATFHMLPESLGIGAYSLFEKEERPAFYLRIKLDKSGQVKEVTPGTSRVRLAANLRYGEVQSALEGEEGDNPYLPQLRLAHELAQTREKARIEAGAVIMQRPDPSVRLEGEGNDIKVDILLEESYPDAQRLVSEMMVLSSSALADWAAVRDIPLIHRTQNITIPKEYAGIWSEAEDLARVIRALVPSVLEIEGKPHAALAQGKYAPVTSPLRRYADLINEAQIFNYMVSGKVRWDKNELEQLLFYLLPSLESVSQTQKFRPRYWKLLYFRQHGDREWWPAVITEENENFVNIALPEKGIFVRGRRNQFDERAHPGMKIRVRLGKVNPLYNEIHIMEVMPEE